MFLATPRRRAMLACALSLALLLTLEAGVASAARFGVKRLRQESALGKVDYLYTAGDTVFAQGLVEKSTRYRFSFVDPSGTEQLVTACRATPNDGLVNAAYTLRADDAVSGPSSWQVVLERWNNATCTGDAEKSGSLSFDNVRAQSVTGAPARVSLSGVGPVDVADAAGPWHVSWIDPSGTSVCSNTSAVVGDWSLSALYDCPAGLSEGLWRLAIQHDGTHFVELPVFSVETSGAGGGSGSGSGAGDPSLGSGSGSGSGSGAGDGSNSGIDSGAGSGAGDGSGSGSGDGSDSGAGSGAGDGSGSGSGSGFGSGSGSGSGAGGGSGSGLGSGSGAGAPDASQSSDFVVRLAQPLDPGADFKVSRGTGRAQGESDGELVLGFRVGGCTLTVRTLHRVGLRYRHNRVRVGIRSRQACTIAVGTTVTLGKRGHASRVGKKAATRRVQLKLRANAKQRIVTLRFSKKALRKIKSALRAKKVLKASIRVTAKANNHRPGSRRVAITVKR